ncbi:MAG: alkaline phosphatase [Planctomycetia bacterium]|nr:alkaline phosphatase [Planctomycetia bacterium]
MKFRLPWYFTLAVAIVCLCCSTLVRAQDVKPVKYVFLFIGDGFSIPQRMMVEEFCKKTGQPPLYLNSLPNHALTTTSSANSFITDSAASGTAIACGEKTNNGQLGVDAAGTGRLTSIAEVARDAGRKVGIVTSVTLNHATPAAFYAHNTSRGAGYEIGLDLLQSNFDYFAGGGLDDQNDAKHPKFEGPLYELAAQKGYTVVHNPDDVLALTPDRGKVIACLEKGALPYAIDHQGGLTLADYTRKGIELLDNPNGFFMMVEGGKIDWMCHANDAATVLWETIAFDAAIQVARDFFNDHADETLIVVTGDHETGGLTLGFAGTGYQSFIETLSCQKCSLDSFRSLLDNLSKEKGDDLTFQDVQPLITENFGLLFPPEDEVDDDADDDADKKDKSEKEDKDDEDEKEQDRMMLNKSELKRITEAYKKSYEGSRSSKALVLAVLNTFNNKASLGWTSSAHTALPVDTSAVGCEAEHFNGMIDNTDIAKLLKQMVL